MGPLTNALNQYMQSKAMRQQQIATQNERYRQDAVRQSLGDMLSGSSAGNLAQLDPNAYMQGQQFLTQQKQAQQEAQQKQAFQRDFQNAMQSGDFVGLMNAYPEQSQTIQNFTKQRDALISSGLGTTAAKIYNAIDRGDTKNMFQIIEDNKAELDSFGDASFGYEQVRDMGIKNTEGLKKLALQTAQLSGVDLGSPDVKPMTEYQKNQIRLRELENETKKLDNKVKSETNDLKKQELELKLKEKQFDLDEAKRKVIDDKVTAELDSDSVIQQADALIDLVDSIENHEGFESAIGVKGASSLYGVLDKPVAGSPAADVTAMMKTLDAKNFLSAIKDFKAAGGTGALSDQEGAKLSSAVASLERDQSEKNVRKQFKIIRELSNLAKERIAKKERRKKELSQPTQPAQYNIGQTARHPDGRVLVFTEQGWVEQ